MKMLIVLNNEVQSCRLSEFLETIGHEVVGLVNSGEEAMDVVNRLVPDIIYIGLNLSGQLDGLQTTKLLNEKSKVSFVFMNDEVGVF